MNGSWRYIKENIDRFAEYRAAVFEQGFVVSNGDLAIGDEYPFWGFWTKKRINERYNAWIHATQRFCLYEKDGTAYFIIGHAYDPFAGLWEESDILESLAKQADGDFERGLQRINDLTGLFVLGMARGEKLAFCGDFESMRSAYYGCVEGRLYLSSHEELVAFFERLNRDEYVTRLESYRWYRLYGEGLPGDISHYHELKKLICNNYVTFSAGEFSTVRIWPRAPIAMCRGEDDYRETVDGIARTMAASMELIAKKWRRPAVSVTGGRDSKGSLAASVHIADRFGYFSYDSQPAEKLDCDAAEKLCRAAGVPHTTYKIPLDKGVYPEYDLVKAILCVNSNRLYFNHNDIMKRIYFRKARRFDVEVKSWTSEIGRAFYYKRYGVRRMQRRCTARRVNAMNNIFLFNPALMYQTDAVYRDYLKRTQYNEHMFNYDWSDIIDLEMRDSRWGADVLSCEHMFSYDVTVPYNNRRLSDMMLRVPLKDRIADRTHIDFTRELCPAVAAAGINVKDAAHGRGRMWLDKIYYFVTSIRLF